MIAIEKHAIIEAMGAAKSTMKNNDGSRIPLFKFDTLDKVVVMSSMYRDFPKNIMKKVKQMAKEGIIQPLHCYGNAYIVANYLIENGYENIRVVDGLYRDLRDAHRFTSTHRFIQYTNPDGLTRYYDPTMEIIPTMSQTWRWEYRALRVIELHEIERFGVLANMDAEKYRQMSDIPQEQDFCGIGSTLNRNIYDSERSLYLLPFINDMGEFVGRIEQYEAAMRCCNEVVGAA